MIAFIVATPLQLFNSVNIVMTKYPKEKVDFYVFSYAVSNMKEYMENLMGASFIRDIIYLDHFCNAHGKLGVLKDYFFESKEVFRGRKYTTLYTTWIGDRSSLIFNLLIKQNRNMELRFYEEGIGIYIFDICNYGNLLLKMYSLFGIMHEKKYIQCVEGYRPELIFCKTDFKTCGIKLIDKTNIEFQQQVNKVFGFKDVLSYKEAFLYLEDCFYRDELDERFEMYETLNQVELLDNISETIGKNNLLVRKHPITKTNNYESAMYKMDVHTKYPWELILLNTDLTSKTLITIISTAVFSPKIMFDEEPIVVILGKMLRNEFKGREPWAESLWSERFEQLVENLKQLYVKAERVIIPENKDELKVCLELLKKNEEETCL